MVINMKKKITTLLVALGLVSPIGAMAATHTVVSGDTMWKIAVKYEVGLSEIIAANPQIENPAMIYP